MSVDVVARLLTPPGATSGVAVVSLEGPDRETRALEMLRSRGEPLRSLGERPRLLELWLDGELVDEAVVVVRRDAVELHVHGSPAVLEAIGRAQPLVDAPAIGWERLLRDATGDAQLALALEQVSRSAEGLDAELRSMPRAAARGRVARRETATRLAHALVVPERIVLLGRQNAGKSTLFNRLLFSERALTGSRPGLTRDAVRETVLLAGYPYELVDTAGLGEAVDELDRRAQSMSVREASAGARRLVVVDGHLGAALDRELLTEGALVVRTKTDLGLAPDWPADVPAISLDLMAADAATRARRLIGDALRRARGLGPAPAGVGLAVSFPAGVNCS